MGLISRPSLSPHAYSIPWQTSKILPGDCRVDSFQAPAMSQLPFTSGVFKEGHRPFVSKWLQGQFRVFPFKQELWLLHLPISPPFRNSCGGESTCSTKHIMSTFLSPNYLEGKKAQTALLSGPISARNCIINLWLIDSAFCSIKLHLKYKCGCQIDSI